MKKLILFMFSVLLLGSCSKYDDNPAISLSSKKSRLVGKWESYILNGQVVDSDDKFTYTFNDGGDFDYVRYNTADGGEWEFSSDKESLRVVFNDGTVRDWEIKKLTKKEFNFSSSSGSEFELQKKD